MPQPGWRQRGETNTGQGSVGGACGSFRYGCARMLRRLTPRPNRKFGRSSGRARRLRPAQRRTGERLLHVLAQVARRRVQTSDMTDEDVVSGEDQVCATNSAPEEPDKLRGWAASRMRFRSRTGHCEMLIGKRNWNDVALSRGVLGLPHRIRCRFRRTARPVRFW